MISMDSVTRLVMTQGPRLFVLGVILSLYWNNLWLIPVVWAVTYGLYTYEATQRESSSHFFRHNRPFYHFGAVINQQRFTVRQANEFGTEVLDAIQQTAIKYLSPSIGPLDITDQAAPNKPYSKNFLKVESVTRYNTKLTTLFQVDTISTRLCIQWWMLLCGEVTQWKLAYFILSAPLTIPFWIVRWFRRDHTIHATLAAEVDNTYDVLDILAWAEAFQEDVYKDVVATLKDLGVDVSDLEQMPLVLNQTNIMGSGNHFGVFSNGSNNRNGAVSQAAAVAGRALNLAQEAAATTRPAHAPANRSGAADTADDDDADAAAAA